MAGRFGLFRFIGLFHFLGVSFRIHVSWLVFAVLLTWALDQYLFPFLVPALRQSSYHLMAFSGCAIYFSSVLLRELVRVLVARRVGAPVCSVTLHVFGGVIDRHDAGSKAISPFVLDVTGVLVNLIIGAAIAFLLLQWVDAQTDLILIALGFFSVLVNWLLALINALLGALGCIWTLLCTAIWKPRR